MNALGSRYLIASAVQRALHGKDHRFRTYEVGEHELVLHLDRVELTPKSLHVARRIEDTIRTMPDAQLGRYIRDAEHLLSRLLAQHTDTASAPLVRLALSCVQSGVAGLMRGGSKVAVSDINAQLTQFDEQLFITMNAEVQFAQAKAQAFMDQKEADLQRMIAQADTEMKADYQRCVADLNARDAALDARAAELDAREAGLRAAVEEDVQMAVRAADQAQADATDARRMLDAAQAQITRERAQADAEIQRLKDTLASERSATVNRERDTRNRIQQLERDAQEAQKVIAHLNRECDRLEGELTQAQQVRTDVSALQETPMPQPAPITNPHLAAMSCAAYLTDHGVPTRAHGTRIETEGVQSIPPHLVEAWEREYPTDTHRKAHLRDRLRRTGAVAA